MMTTEHSLVARGLRKRYGTNNALDGFDLEVARGSIHSLLGPNGAGKSTAVRAMATLIRLDGGTATIDGFDASSQPHRVRERIGLVGQNTAVDEVLGGRQNLVMFGRLFGLGTTAARLRADELLEQYGLAEVGAKAVSAYSGGMRRRLDIAASLILRPAVLFLDEPTTGLDPRGRSEVWGVVRQVSAQGTTVLLTTQYLDEADQLADRVSVMDAGAVVAEGSPSELKREFGGERLELVVRDAQQLAVASTVLERVTGAPVVTDADNRHASSPTENGTAALLQLVRELDSSGVDLDDLTLRRPTLDEVFLTLTETETAE